MHLAGLIRVDESVKKPKKYIRNNYEKSKIFIDSSIQCGQKNGWQRIKIITNWN